MAAASNWPPGEGTGAGAATVNAIAGVTDACIAHGTATGRAAGGNIRT